MGSISAMSSINRVIDAHGDELRDEVIAALPAAVRSIDPRVVLTNTLPLPAEKRLPKIEVLSVAKIIADALSAVFDETSVSELFGGENQS